MNGVAVTARLLAVAELAVAGLVAAPAAALARIDSPLEGYWPMIAGQSQKISDISGNGNTGMFGRFSTPDRYDPDWVPGMFGVGSALHFDDDDYVEVPETASLRPKQVTVEAWARRAGSPGQYNYIASKGGDGCHAGSFGLYTSINGGAAFYVYDGKRWYRSPMVTPAVWDGQWHHFAGTYDGKAVRLYVDGREIGTGTTFSGTIAYDLPRRPLYIGAYRGGCDLTMDGDIDEVRLWSTALSIDAIWDTIRKFITSEPAAPALPEDAGDWARIG